MDGLLVLLVKAYKGIIHFSNKRQREKDGTVTRLVTFSDGFDQELRRLSKYLNAEELDIVRLAIAVYIFQLECVKNHPKGEWVFYEDEDAEESAVVLENSVFLPVSE